MCEELNSDMIELALSPDDVYRIAGKGKLVAMIGVENGYPLGMDITRVKEFYDLGARYITLTHMGYNQLGDSSNASKGIPAQKYGGLTDFGRQVVQEMNRLGMMVDISHVSPGSFYDTLSVTKAPVIASHSGCRALCDVPRNLDDSQLDALRENGGVIQIVSVGGFIRKNRKEANLGYFVDHIDHAVNRMGIDHVGIGSDFDGGGGIPGFNDATECVNVTIELVGRGYSREDIEKIWGRNLLRVWKEVEQAGAQIRKEKVRVHELGTSQ
jgi:membrane dipeptidase